MGICASCKAIKFGGIKVDGARYCNDACYQNALFRQEMLALPDDILQPMLAQMHAKDCPKCKRHGPVDIHSSFMLYSIIIISRHSATHQLCCKACGVKAQLGAALFSALCGWRSISGVLMTPFVILFNLWGIFLGPDGKTPSKQLGQLVARQLVQTNRDLKARPAAFGQ